MTTLICYSNIQKRHEKNCRSLFGVYCIYDSSIGTRVNQGFVEQIIVWNCEILKVFQEVRESPQIINQRIWFGEGNELMDCEMAL